MIIQGIATSFLLDILQGVHTPTDEYRIALYTNAAKLSPDVRAYFTEGETRGNGYTPGGQKLLGYTALSEDGAAFIDWADATWPNVSITARAALIYNYSKQNRAVAVLDLGGDYTSTNGQFTVVFPEPTAKTALIAIR